MPAVLEAPSAVATEDVELVLDPLHSAAQPDDGATVEHRLLVDCAVCESTHPPGTETDPACPTV